MYLLDTDYIVNFLKGNAEFVNDIEGIKDSDLATSIICIGEVLEGIFFTKSKTKKAEFF